MRGRVMSDGVWPSWSGGGGLRGKQFADLDDAARQSAFDLLLLSAVRVDDIVQKAHRGKIPLGYVGAAAEMGNAVAFLCSDAASYLTGVTLPVAGGLLRGIF
jgi:NAD(P)-dependent dehydrogenase (short-subunit alcohol dehydrogenase family)